MFGFNILVLILLCAEADSNFQMCNHSGHKLVSPGMKSSEAESTEMRPTYMNLQNMIKFLIFEDRQSSGFRNDCALSIRMEQENIFFGPRHFLCFIEADQLNPIFVPSILFSIPSLSGFIS